MTNISRRQLLGMAGGAAALGIVGCGDDDDDDESTATTAPASAAASTAASTATTAPTSAPSVKPAAEITYWSVHPANSKAVEEELIKRFEAANPGIKVKLETAGANYAEVSQKFNAGLASKQIPDLVMLSDVWWFKYFLAGTIEPLDGLISELKVDTADYQDTLLKDYQFDGKQWGMPFARSTPLFYYNKDKWAAAGLPAGARRPGRKWMSGARSCRRWPGATSTPSATSRAIATPPGPSRGSSGSLEAATPTTSSI